MTGDFPSEEPTTRFRAEAIDVAALRRDASASQPAPAGMPPAPGVPIPPPAIPHPAPPSAVPLGQPPLTTYGAGGSERVSPAAAPAAGQRIGTRDDAASGVYQSKRGGLAFGLGVATVVLEIPLLRALGASALGHLSVAGVIASMLAMIGLPLLALGLYPALCGAASGRDQEIWVWARTPLAYLPVGLALLFAAAIAAA